MMPTRDDTRCPTCLAPLLVRPDSTTYRPHLSWCRWAPKRRPPVVVLPALSYDDDDRTSKEHPE